MNYLFLLLLCLSTTNVFAGYDLKALLTQQAANPQNAKTNYNLGVAQYKTSSYESAAHNFLRAYEHADKNKTLRKQAQFNAGKSFEQYGVHLLPEKWEEAQTKIDDATLEKAIKALEQAVTEYKKDASDKKTQINLERAEDILAKLRKKKQQQEEQKKQDEQDKDKQNDENDQEDKQNQQDQENNKQQQSGNGKQNNNNQQQNQNQNQQEQQQDNDDASNNGDKVDQNKQQGNENKKQDAGKKNPEDARKAGEEGQQDESENDNAKNNEQQKQKELDHKETSDNEGDKKDGSAEQHALEQGMQSGDKKQETMQDRRMQAILENLQADESKKQKNLLLRQLGNNQSPQQHGQKPW